MSTILNPSADRCLALQVAALFVVQQTSSTGPSARSFPGSSRAQRQRSPGPAQTSARRNLMNAMAPTRPIELQLCRVRLAIWAWDVPADPDVAVLLTSELVTNAIRHEPGGTITLVITCSPGQLRVEVHDTSRFLPVL